MDKSVEIAWIQGRAWRATTRGHEVIADSPRESGGDDAGMTPVELMVASMGLCMGINLSYYGQRHPAVDLAQIRMSLTWADAPDKPGRVGTIQAWVKLPEGLTDEERATLTRAAHACKVHHTLQRGVEVTVMIE